MPKSRAACNSPFSVPITLLTDKHSSIALKHMIYDGHLMAIQHCMCYHVCMGLCLASEVLGLVIFSVWVLSFAWPSLCSSLVVICTASAHTQRRHYQAPLSSCRSLSHGPAKFYIREGLKMSECASGIPAVQLDMSATLHYPNQDTCPNQETTKSRGVRIITRLVFWHLGLRFIQLDHWVGKYTCSWLESTLA